MGVHMLSKRLDLSNVFDEAELSLTTFSLPSRYPLHAGMIHSAHLIDRPQSCATGALESTFACGWYAQTPRGLF